MKDNRGRTNAIEIAQLQNARCSTALRGNNIETPDQMYDAMCKATALSGFTANVLDIRERKSYAKKKKIKNILKIDHVKYDYRDKSQTKFHVWQYSNIGSGKKIDIPSQPKAPKYEEKMTFYDGREKFGCVSDKKRAFSHILT